MDEQKQDPAAKEQKLIKLYCELTGCTEAGARSVYMLVDPSDANKAEAANQLSEPPKPAP